MSILSWNATTFPSNLSTPLICRFDLPNLRSVQCSNARMARQTFGRQDLPQLPCVHSNWIHQDDQMKQVNSQIRRWRHRKQGNGRKTLGCQGSSYGGCWGGKYAPSTKCGANEEHDDDVWKAPCLHTSTCCAAHHQPTQGTLPTPKGMPPLQQEACQSQQVLGTWHKQALRPENWKSTKTITWWCPEDEPTEKWQPGKIEIHKLMKGFSYLVATAEPISPPATPDPTKSASFNHMPNWLSSQTTAPIPLWKFHNIGHGNSLNKKLCKRIAKPRISSSMMPSTKLEPSRRQC